MLYIHVHAILHSLVLPIALLSYLYIVWFVNSGKIRSMGTTVKNHMMHYLFFLTSLAHVLIMAPAIRVRNFFLRQRLIGIRRGHGIIIIQ